MSIETINIDKGASIDVKRFYLSGIAIESKCPKCKESIEFSGDSEYISYPVIGEKETVCLYCNNCNINYLLELELKISISFDKSILKEE